MIKKKKKEKKEAERRSRKIRKKPNHCRRKQKLDDNVETNIHIKKDKEKKKKDF